jgi:hypothetical protein
VPGALAAPAGEAAGEAEADGVGCPAVAEAGVVAAGAAGASRGQATITTVPPFAAALPPIPDRSAK